MSGNSIKKTLGRYRTYGRGLHIYVHPLERHQPWVLLFFDRCEWIARELVHCWLNGTELGMTLEWRWPLEQTWTYNWFVHVNGKNESPDRHLDLFVPFFNTSMLHCQLLTRGRETGYSSNSRWLPQQNPLVIFPLSFLQILQSLWHSDQLCVP